jgi:hypothetical protein
MATCLSRLQGRSAQLPVQGSGAQLPAKEQLMARLGGARSRHPVPTKREVQRVHSPDVVPWSTRPRLAPQRAGRQRGGRRLALAWCAGVRSSVLADCPSERGLYNALGFAVLLTALMSGFTMTVALGYVLGVAAIRLWPVGLLWGAVIFNIDRLLQMMAAGKRMFLSLIPRLAISLIIGIGIAEPLVLIFNHREIDNQIQYTTQQEVQRTQTSITNYYEPQIAAAQQQIAGIQSEEASLQAQVNRNDFLADCEANEAVCSYTHELGCGPFCHHYQQLAATAQEQLNTERPQAQATIGQLNSKIQNVEADEKTEIKSGTDAITSGNGFIAREEALSQIIRAHPVVGFEVWFLRIGLITLDLLPLIIKYLHVVFGEAAYERINLADRRREGSRAHRIDVDVKVETARIEEQGAADTEVNRVKIQAERDRRIADAEERWFGGKPTNSSASSNQRITAMSLTELTQNWKSHHKVPVPISGALRAAGWAGTGLIVALALCLGALTYYGHHLVTGEWLVFLALLAALSLAAFTKGFREAPGWAIRATFATLLAGLALPALIAALNL